MLLAACVIIPISVGARFIQNRTLADYIAWTGLTTMGFSLRFVVTCCAMFFCCARVSRYPGNKPQCYRYVGTVGVVSALFFTLIGLIIARRPASSKSTFRLRICPRRCRVFDRAESSDLHVGSTIKRGFVERIVARSIMLNADLIAITGDWSMVRYMICHRTPQPLAGLAARHAVYFVTGNHEYYSGERAWTAELRRLG